MKAETKITCNGCPNLKIVKRTIKLGKQNCRNTWILFCRAFENDVHISTIEVRNKDLNNTGMPEIQAPFICPLRQQERIKGREQKFELSI